MANFLYRIAGTATLDSRTYEDVGADQTATPQALTAFEIGSRLLALGFMIMFGLLAGPILSAQATTADHQLPSAAPVYDGAQLFRNHCATCHGAGGRGNGPMSEALRKPPADLTTFALKGGGVFPTERLRRIIDGRDVPSHGDRDMPVWGIALRTSRDAGGYDSVEAGIDALVRYIQSLQERAAQ